MLFRIRENYSNSNGCNLGFIKLDKRVRRHLDFVPKIRDCQIKLKICVS